MTFRAHAERECNDIDYMQIAIKLFACTERSTSRGQDSLFQRVLGHCI